MYGEEPPTPVQRNAETLKQIFREHNLDEDRNKDLFETLIEWKRTL